MSEGQRIDIRYPDGGTQSIEPKAHETSFTLALSDAPSGIERIQKATIEAGRLMGDDMSKTMLQTISSSDSPAFARFGGKTPEELLSQMLDAVKRMHVEFDESGRPTFEVVVHPDNVELLKAIDTPENRALFDAAIEVKRHEWTDRESHRKLAD